MFVGTDYQADQWYRLTVVCWYHSLTDHCAIQKAPYSNARSKRYLGHWLIVIVAGMWHSGAARGIDEENVVSLGLIDRATERKSY